ncbi:MAG: hypothetical protein HYW80_01795 [Parcubacteria group bacterium]|nr:hypothetical protein [Parcubacteria group bacterium]
MLIQALASIALIYGAVIAVNRLVSKKFCPICAGVSLTWLWLAAALFLGLHNDRILLAILMGGSVIGIMYMLKRTPWAHLYAVFGFSSVYFLLEESWFWFGMTLLPAIFLGLWQRQKPMAIGVSSGNAEINEKVEEIEKKLEECCP